MKTITYKGKTESVLDWSNELNIRTSTIYSRLKRGWPPELVLSRKDFHFCTSYKAAKKVQQCNDYPNNYHSERITNCCTTTSICRWAIPLTPWSEIKDNPSKGNYYCRYKSTNYGEFVVGDNPTC